VETNFQLRGVDELKRTLAALNAESATKAGTVATREGAKIVKEAFVAAAPVGTERTIRTRTTKKGKKVKADYGRLRDNITIRKVRGTNQHQIKFAVGVGDAFWGMFLEFGTRFMAARPWMRPAFDAAASRVIDQIGSLLGKGIEREGKRLFRKGRKQGLL
jgi:hypothetical protein